MTPSLWLFQPRSNKLLIAMKLPFFLLDDAKLQSSFYMSIFLSKKITKKNKFALFAKKIWWYKNNYYICARAHVIYINNIYYITISMYLTYYYYY